MTDEFEQECRLLNEMGLKDSPLRLECNGGNPIEKRLGMGFSKITCSHPQ